MRHCGTPFNRVLVVLTGVSFAGYERAVRLPGGKSVNPAEPARELRQEAADYRLTRTLLRLGARTDAFPRTWSDAFPRTWSILSDEEKPVSGVTGLGVPRFERCCMPERRGGDPRTVGPARWDGTGPDRLVPPPRARLRTHRARGHRRDVRQIPVGRIYSIELHLPPPGGVTPFRRRRGPDGQQPPDRPSFDYRARLWPPTGGGCVFVDLPRASSYVRAAGAARPLAANSRSLFCATSSASFADRQAARAMSRATEHCLQRSAARFGATAGRRSRYASDAHALAPPHGQTSLDLRRSRAWAPSTRREARRADLAPRAREPALGPSAHRRRAQKARLLGLGDLGSQSSPSRGDRPRRVGAVPPGGRSSASRRRA
jgi:hypothetical protein